MDSTAPLTGELIDLVDPDSFLTGTPVPYSPFRSLLDEYGMVRAKVEALGTFLDDKAEILQIFLDGNVSEGRHASAVREAKGLFAIPGAVAALNSRYWARALELTGLRDSLPAPRRAEWEDAIRGQTCPEFDEDTLKSTIEYLVSMQGHFLSERIDGLFRGLSRGHLTNTPQGFGKRMILAGAYSEYGGHPEWRVTDLITDLRRVVATFMGRPEPDRESSSRILRLALSKGGDWLAADGGAFRIRAYRGVCTAHLEVAEEMAWRLNAMLANLYPQAIPESFRTRPPKSRKPKSGWGRIHRPLPVPVLAVIGGIQWDRTNRCWYLSSRDTAELLAAREEAKAILEGIGAVFDGPNHLTFPFEASDVLAEIVCTGMIPDTVSHQFYPTEAPLAERVARLAAVQDGMTVLEPSAGQGGLADHLPKHQTLCVEIAALNVAVLNAKGYDVVPADFLLWSEGAGRERRFDRVVMNPPYRQGQAVAHLETAWRHVAAGGRLVAILPASLLGKIALPGGELIWSEAIEGAFPGVSVAVAILVAERPA